jgi:hypothetical protein
MLYVFGFEKIGVVVSDLYFLDPFPDPGQGDGAERGVRLEIRLLEQGTVDGTIYASRPITIGRPLWRGDLLETVEGPMGSFDRTHHHVAMVGWEPDKRVFDERLSADPLGFLKDALSDLPSLLSQAIYTEDEIGAHDVEDLRASVPEIVDIVASLLRRIYDGELAQAPEGDVTEARLSWL